MVRFTDLFEKLGESPLDEDRPDRESDESGPVDTPIGETPEMGEDERPRTPEASDPDEGLTPEEREMLASLSGHGGAPEAAPAEAATSPAISSSNS